MKVLVVGPLKDFSGYAHIGRNLVNGLKTAGADVVTRNLKYDDYNYVPSDEEAEMYKSSIRDCDIVLQLTTPNEMRYVPGKMNIALMFWETTKIPRYWVDQLNLMDMIIAPCRFNAAVLAQCGVTKPICISHPVFDVQVYDKQYEPFNIPGAGNRTLFYNICQLSAKKGIDVLLKAFFRAFADVPDEGMLVLKSYIGMANRKNETDRIKQLIQQVKDGMRMPLQKYPSVYIITDIFEDDDIYRLHKSCHAYVCSSRGEGWGIPPFEAMALGTPLISHNWSSLGDFVNDKNAIVYGGQTDLVFDNAHPDPFLYTSLEEWFEPNAYQLMIAMRNFHEIRMGRDAGKLQLSKEDIVGKAEQGRADLRQFDLRNGGPKILAEIKRCYELWKKGESFAVTEPGDENEINKT